MPIYKRGSGFMVSVGSGENRLRESYKTKQEAEVAELEALTRLKLTGSPLKPSGRPLEASPSPERKVDKGKTLKDAFDITWRLRWKDSKSASTFNYHVTSIFRSIKRDTPLSEINPLMVLEVIEEWEDEGNNGSTVNRKVSALSTMLTVAAEQGWCAFPKLPRRTEGKHRVRWVDEDEEQTILSWCRKLELHDLHDLVIVAIDTGFRRSELLGLVSRDLVNGQLHLHPGQTKSDKGRAVPVTQRVAEVIKRRAGGRRIFEMSTETLRSHWKALRKAMRLEEDPQFVFHCLRHTCASRLVQNGVPLAVVQAWMGHATIVTTMRYAHLSPDSLVVGREALEKVNQKPHLKVVNG